MATTLLSAALIGTTACSDDSDSASALPGGKHGKDILGERWFNKDGKLYHPEAAPSDEKQAALCDYIYGTPAEVGKLAKLKGTVTLGPDSGFLNLGGNGFQYGCVYAVDGTDAYKVAVWFGRDSDEPLKDNRGTAVSLATVDFPDGVGAYSVYGPDYTGDTIDDATAKQWLTEARARIED